MRVIVLSQYYFPEPVEKVHDLARGLVRLGHEVQVITGFPCYPDGKVYPGYRQSLSFMEKMDGVEITRLPQFPDHSRSFFRRSIYYLSFAFGASFFGLLKALNADVMLVYQAALPIGLSAWAISKTRRIPFVLDVVDLWPESVVVSGMLKSRIVIGFLRRVAAFVYRSSRHISVVTEGFKKNLVALGIPDKKITVIHNWMPADTYRKVAPNQEQAQKEGLAGRFNVMYAGNMGPAQNLQTVIEAADKLHDLPQVQFVFVGGGLEYSELVALARKKRSQNVLFLGRRPPEEMSSLYVLADILLVHLKPDILTEISIPSKIFAYMASGRPVLAAVKGDAAEFVTSNRFGLAVTPSDPVKLADAVRWFFSLSPEDREKMGQNALRAYQEKFCSDIQVRRMEDVLARVVSCTPL
jgi:colanic acid biosynthesis glycosyl transferase WcaI